MSTKLQVSFNTIRSIINAFMYIACEMRYTLRRSVENPTYEEFPWFLIQNYTNMKKTLIALVACTSVAAAAVTGHDGNYTFTADDWEKSGNDYILTLSGTGFDLSGTSWELTYTFNALSGTGVNQWGTNAFANGTNTGGNYGAYKNGIQSYIAVGGDVRFLGGGFESNGDAITLGKIATNKVVSLTYTITRTEAGTTLVVKADNTQLGSSTITDNSKWNNVTLTKLCTNISDSQINKGWSLASGSFKIISVPEPTTATLSLLALAGLAARRRRK